MRTNHKFRSIAVILLGCGLLISACTPEPMAAEPPENIEQDQAQNPQPEEFSEVEPIQQIIPAAYPIVDTGQTACYDSAAEIFCPAEGEAYYGQDAQYAGNASSYTDNGDGTVTDNVTGLIWQQDPGEKMTFQQAVSLVESFELAEYQDWRLPTIKELYSLIQFSGLDPSTYDPGASGLIPFIDTDYFYFEYGDNSSGERVIDSQWATSSVYGSTVFDNRLAMFGVNFADGRIKGYPIDGQKTFFVIYVRGNPSYAENNFIDNGDGTITDQATGLTWMQEDSRRGMDWESALNYCETLDYAGSSGWRLPNAKELQSIVDYDRSPDSTNSAAIDPLFSISTITNEVGQTDYPYFWTSTTNASLRGGSQGVYIAFGRAMGYMNGNWMDVHGAGAQRSDEKSGDPSDCPTGRGPQGDAVHIDNYVRCVSGGTSADQNPGSGIAQTGSPSTEQAIPAQSQPEVNASPTQGGAPPQEAIDACLGQTVNSGCTISTPNGCLSGSCTLIEVQMACVPSGGPGGPPPNP
jgi:hypothetical protein